MKRKIKDDNVRRRLRRAMRIRRSVQGTSERPRLSVFRSAKHLYAQLIDDVSGKTLASSSTMTKSVQGEAQSLAKRDASEQVGKDLAEKAKAAGITSCVFDRKGWPFHGRIAALAKGAREGGLEF